MARRAMQVHAEMSDPLEGQRIDFDAAFEAVSHHRTSKYEGPDFHTLCAWLRFLPSRELRDRSGNRHSQALRGNVRKVADRSHRDYPLM